MPRPLINIEPLLDDIAQDTLILTPNSRLKNKLLQAYNHHQQQQKLTVWPNIKVYALREWLLQCYEQLLGQGLLEDPRALASKLQLQQLWLQVIESNTDGLELINPLRLATDAASAFSSLEQWQLSVAELDCDSDQQRQFCEWAEQFQSQMAAQKLQTFENLQNQVNQAFISGRLPQQKKLMALDFGTVSPLVSESLQVMAEQLQQNSTHAIATERCQRIACNDRNHEARQAALWARNQLQQEQTATIGIVVPNLGQERERIARHLTEVFEPHYLLPETSRYTLPFNFSTGVPLGATPLISNTLALLRLNNRQWTCQALTDLLYSPFWGVNQDLAFQEQLLARLEGLGRDIVQVASLRQICHELQQQHPCTYGQWLDKTLQDFEAQRRRIPARQSPSHWIETFQTQLQQLGWPGERRLDSNEYQQIQQWQTLLEDFCRLDHVQPALTVSEALDLLNRHASGTPFQAQTRESPIQVLGALEAAGLVFDQCWVMGMSHAEWPATAQPNPLLPLDMQRQLRMPHADATRELEYARELTGYYQRCANTVIFSHPLQGEESHLSPSQLIQHIPEVTAEALGLANQIAPLDHHIACQRQAVALEAVDSHRAPPLSHLEQQHVRGGSQILRNQAINPMAAFLIHRLGARQPIEPTAGFSPIQRGQILHNALKIIWDKLGDQQQLLTAEPEALQQLVKTAVTEQVKRYQRREPGVIGDNYAANEISRQSRLIIGWLDQEKQRPGFTVIAHEQSIHTELAGLPLTLRLDRLDQLATGELIVIDYKTGSPNIKHWGGDRPEEPQLPLYALAYQSDIQALMFVQINARQTTAMGIGQLQDYHPDISPASDGAKMELPDNWPEILQHWQQTLESLAQEFQQGHTLNQFKGVSQQHFYEYLSPILRLNQQPPVTEDKD
ncbi:MAG: PD-(D/E)XK nuclease family protein [Candidatus Pelagadaptatus aseana]|uniref:PD-(D/E)XK nuclease family protein n=1 Tax=Candidatus Pelagadaptatus aseana TaxID=3120508 RepID=UPI0039B23CF0